MAKKAKSKLTRAMWERIEGLSASLRADVIAEKVLPEIGDDATKKLAEAQLTVMIRRWLLAKLKKIAPEQMVLFERENGGLYGSLDAVPEALLRKRSSKLRVFGEGLIKIADAIDEHLAARRRREA
jgi:hypothetical protein